MLNNTIKSLRMAKKLNQSDLANALGVTKQCISNWENDNILPSVDMLIRIAQFFEVSTDYLLGLEDKRSIDVSNLSNEEIAHITFLIEDLNKYKK